MSFLKAYTICFREDVFYGCAYYDEIGMFILPLDPDYCKISGIYNTGDFAFAMDMSYFRSRQTMLELWGEPFPVNVFVPMKVILQMESGSLCQMNMLFA